MTGQGDAAPTPCSCGVAGCRELGWPHEWDPLIGGDRCTVTPPPIISTVIDGVARYWPPEDAPHAVTAPYVRWGSGYSCVACVERHGTV